MRAPPPEKTATGSLTTKVLNRHALSEQTVEIEIMRPPAFAFEPGQRIRFLFGAEEREYSLLSAPSDPTLSLCVRMVKGGIFSPVLGSARIGASFQFTGPHGYFVFRPTGRPAVFVATGTGVAPFVSMARSGVSGFTLLHGVPTEAELYYHSLFRRASARYVPCLSRIKAPSKRHRDSFQGRVTAYLEKRLSPGVYDFYLCGRADMIHEVTHLVDARFPGSLVHTEVFYA